MRVRFYAELGDFLPPENRGREFERAFPAGGAVKDLIEGLGVPHTEVDLVLVNGESVGFSHRLANGDRVSIYPVFEALDISSVTAVRPEPLRVVRFVADVHLGRLARFLRLAGFDTVYENNSKDVELARISLEERRILLTRDRGLLMRSAVTHGYLVRSVRPREQLREVLERFDLWRLVRPLSRCSLCNGMLEKVDKEQVAPELPEKTIAFTRDFWRCSRCGKIYWHGSHFRSLASLFTNPDAT